MKAKLEKVLVVPALSLILAACSSSGATESTAITPIRPEIGLTDEQFYDGGVLVGENAEANMQTFDELDFEIFSNQDWGRLHESHADDIIVTWPDGSDRLGAELHIEDLRGLFVHAPDTRIQLHPIRIAAGDWTAVHGFMEGTFTQPMPLPDGTSIEPTGMSFKLPMSTMALWQDGQMIHEWLFWDNETYKRQMGLID